LALTSGKNPGVRGGRGKFVRLEKLDIGGLHQDSPEEEDNYETDNSDTFLHGIRSPNSHATPVQEAKTLERLWWWLPTTPLTEDTHHANWQCSCSLYAATFL
jgi:hypothetical protein